MKVKVCVCRGHPEYHYPHGAGSDPIGREGGTKSIKLIFIPVSGLKVRI